MRHSLQLDFEQGFESPIESLNDLTFGSISLTPVNTNSDNFSNNPPQPKLLDLSDLDTSDLGTKVTLPETQTLMPAQRFSPELSGSGITQQASTPNFCHSDTSHSHSHGAGLQSGETVAQFNNRDGRFKWDQPGGKGKAVDITYSFAPNFKLSGLSNSQAKSLFREALGVWADASPLNFREIRDPGNGSAVDIRVEAEFIDGRSNTLAFAFFPQGGDQTYDTGETWNSSLFLETAVHETGHSLGLDHESGVNAIMNPTIQGRFNGPGSAFLLQDDINGIRSLYGSGQGSVQSLPSSPSPSPAPSPTPTPSPSPTSTPNLTPNSQQIDGTTGRDTLRGGADDEMIRGFAGNDRLIGAAGRDLMYGGSGNDRTYAGSGNDRVYGGPGNDLLVGGKGNDAMFGGGGRDRLIGVYTRAGQPGVGEIDQLTGGKGPDTFVLGDQQKVYYADGPATSNYAVVKDFTLSQEDVLQLNGKASDYSLGSSPQGLPSGTALVYEGGTSNEIIAIIQGDTNLSLNSSAFKYV